ncbi:PIG-L family deacetylase [Flavobacterium aquatile]|uniref:LmbE family protein n=1 Tax=Flavobacterium aquatile LMG 4008 = ATCC 11947 TaxID=1453498 RepID=A0A095SRZ1_9FLAO|nr:PIG-L family deacetylase [Flavobacterium aquatile]KGD67416.1 LmbE family protein [Flavobacterium aquatile LMG 4008 = ATCC 11947]OXA66952.1 LmbE family protein [Flavobacterium aquatile] [Flavobacterium aquatile LMG 4008 = ATCC 11947]GEC78797.1 PIG-L domain-containing protein [Flavobacterium aquatile]
MQKIFTFLTLLIGCTILAQKPQKPNAVELYHQIEKLNFLGSVLYIAAHPDDENTRLISYLSNEKNARTGYLSLTRGDGGQNLIGLELRELLGVIRTQELIEARKIDGGEQLFTRANDFGFSKNPDETLQIWDKNQVLSDVIWAIRKFQPDVIINRFDHRSPGTTHGHHTSSAMLSLEAFDKTNDASVFPNQLKYATTWQPKRVFFNTSWWFYGSKEKFDAADKTNLSKLQTGVYYEQFGKSNQEIAALSRSCHQSQGFGNTGTRGEEDEYLEFLKGESLKDKTNLFEGIDTSWNRVKNGKAIGDILENVQKNFDFKNPSASISELVKAYDLIQNLDDKHWKTIKSEEIKKIIAGCAGLYLEAVADNQEVASGSTIKVKLEAINRSNQKMNWNAINTVPNSFTTLSITELPNNKLVNQTIELQITDENDYTNPYYLKESGTDGMYVVNNQENIGKPDVIRQIKVTFLIEINGITIPFERNVVYKYNDDVKGEVYQPLDVVPVVTSSIQEKVYIFPNNKEKAITVKIKAGKDAVSGTIQLEVPQNWTVSPTSIPFSLSKKGEEQLAIFNVTPSKEASEIVVKSVISVDGKTFDKEKIDINYPHIFKQMVLKSAEAKAIKLNIKTKGEKIAYIMGAGDEVPKSLTQMGYEVTILKPEDISTERLQNFDVVMTGIRAYNVVTTLGFKQNILLDFVKNGKTMIVQYNTLDEFVTKDIAPFPIKISRDRVTEENAEVRFLAPNHAILNYPNKITQEDFKGWKQEQGLYYPSEWDKNFTPIISSNDKGEKPKDGAILVAKHGKGHYIYTGISFFRELPEGVAGAFRLLSNMIAIGK